MSWFLVLLAATIEIFWASALKHAQTPLEWIGIGLLIAVSFVMLIRSYKTIPVAAAYTVFVGLGTTGTYVVGMIMGEPFSLIQILFLILLLTGIIGMKLTTEEEKPEAEGADK